MGTYRSRKEGSAGNMAAGLVVSVIGMVLSLAAGTIAARVLIPFLVRYIRIPGLWSSVYPLVYPLIIHFIGFLCVCYGGVTVLKCKGRPGYGFYRGAVSILFILVTARYFIHVMFCFIPPPGY